MARVTVRGGVKDLQADLVRIAKEAPVELRGVVREGIKVGNSVARDFARVSAGEHGRLYPGTFSYEMHGAASSLAGGNLYSGAYGPDASKPQGDMSFEWGSRNQDPHLDLNRSADLIGPAMPGEIRDRLDRLFW